MHRRTSFTPVEQQQQRQQRRLGYLTSPLPWCWTCAGSQKSPIAVPSSLWNLPLGWYLLQDPGAKRRRCGVRDVHFKALASSITRLRAWPETMSWSRTLSSSNSWSFADAAAIGLALVLFSRCLVGSAAAGLRSVLAESTTLEQHCVSPRELSDHTL